jgi:hypothetical protein
MLAAVTLANLNQMEILNRKIFGVEFEASAQRRELSLRYAARPAFLSVVTPCVCLSALSIGDAGIYNRT